MKTITLITLIAVVIAAKHYADSIPLPTAQDTGRAGEVTK